MREHWDLVAPIGALISAFLVSGALTPMTGRLALRLGIIDHPSQDPSGHKQHANPTPYLGGLALFAGLVVGSSFVLLAVEGIPLRSFGLMIGAGLLLGGVGLYDDIRPLPRSVRFIVQVAIAIVAWDQGFGVGTTPWDLSNATLTVLWVVGITNAFNLLDNMDGVSAGLAGIAAASFAVMAYLAELPVLPTIAAALAGAALGFLRHNRHPAKVFMGDAGSLFLGFLIALLGLRLRFDNLPQVTFMVPVVVLGLPILDTVLVVISRRKAERPIFLGGRDHVAHRLVRLGLTIGTSVRVMYLAAISTAWLAVAISRSTPPVGFILLGFVLSIGSLMAWFLLKVDVYESAPSARSPDALLERKSHLEEVR